MAETQKLNHSVLVIGMLLLITNIAVAYNVAAETTNATGNSKKDSVVYFIHFSMHACFLLNFFF